MDGFANSIIKITNNLVQSPFPKSISLHVEEGFPEEVIETIRKALKIFKRKYSKEVYPTTPVQFSTILCISGAGKRGFIIEPYSSGEKVRAFCDFYYKLDYVKHPSLNNDGSLNNWYLEVCARPLEYLASYSEENQRIIREYEEKYNFPKRSSGLSSFVDQNLKRFLREIEKFDREEFLRNPNVDNLIPLLTRLTLEEHIETNKRGGYGVFTDSPWDYLSPDA